MLKLPNVLVIMSDDQGAWAMGCAGNPDICTPNHDRLATEGTRFDHFFCTSPVCSPARASFLTGRTPSDHGVHDWIRKGNVDDAEDVMKRGVDRPIEYLEGLDGFTDHLAKAGYNCGFSGKWHLGASGIPQKGNDWWYAYALGGGNYYDYYRFDNSPEADHKTQYMTDYYTDRALEFIDDNAGSEEPFCLSLHYTAPHTPLGRDQHSAEMFALYDDCTFYDMPRDAPHPWHGWNPTEEERCETLRGYFAAISAMDGNIGRVLEKLDALGIRENTLVIFLSDNGFSVGHHGIFGKGNGTYPMNMYEESVKIPFIVSMPGTVPASVVHSGMWSQYDWMPTILDFLGIDNPESKALPGSSFAHVLRGEDDPGRERVVVFDEYGPVRMIRTREWKYVHRYPDGPHELYNLVDDPKEYINLMDDPESCADTVTILRGDLEEWFKKYSNPERDGSKLPVTGSGQYDMSDRVDDTVTAFAQLT